MKQYCIWSVVLLLAVAPLWSANRAIPQKSKSLYSLDRIAPGTYVQGEVIVKLSISRPIGLLKGRSGSTSLDAVLSTLIAPRLEQMFVGHERPPDDPSLVDLSKYYVVHYAGPSDAVAISKLLMHADDVEFAEPRFRYTYRFTPNDPLYNMQWHLARIQAETAWDISQGDSTVVIAIIDSGVDVDQEDLKNNIWNNPGEVGLDAHGNDKRFNGIDDDGDGYIDDWLGWDFYQSPTKQPDNDPSPGSPHGTHVAGIAAAVTNNGTGVAGVAPHCKIMAVKAGPDDPTSNEISYQYEGMVYAADRGANIINCSFSGPGYSQTGQDVINYATQKGSLVVAAAGNGGTDEIGDNIDNAEEYPAGFTNVIAVASTGQSDQKSTFSNYGYTVALSAPGEYVISTLPNDSYGAYSGTSMSTPIVAGVAALVKSHTPSLTPMQVGQQVRISADNIDASNPGYVHTLGFGRVNAYRALTVQSPAIRMTNHTVSDSGTGNNDGIFNPLEVIQIDPTITNYLLPSDNITVTLSSASPYITIQNPSQQVGTLGTLESRRLSVPFRVTIGDNAPENQIIQCILTISAGSYTDYGSISFLVHPTFLDMNSNQITMTVTSQGNLGYNDYPNNLQGSGFLYKPTGTLNYLFEGSLMIGTDSSHVVDAARGSDIDFQSADFEPLSNFIIKKPGSIADEQGSGLFSDGNAAENQLGIRVQYGSFAFINAPNDNFILLRYDITNVSSKVLTNFCAGLYFDWDVGSSGNNLAAVDTSLRLAYVYDATAGTTAGYVGVVMLSQEPFVFRAIDNAATGNPWGVYDGFTKAEKWNALSSGVSQTSAGPSDVSMVIGLGPRTLAASDSVVVPFALLAAQNLTDLTTAAQHAITEWSLIRDLNYIKLTPYQFTLFQNYPNPFNSGTIIRFTIEHQGSVSLKVYDVLGREVETLVDDVRSPGLYEVLFPKTKMLSSGVYFYRIASEGKTVVRKMVYIR